MERPELFNQTEGDTMPTPLADGSKPGTTENTRLFDIRTLANHTKQRISKQLESQNEAEAALLSSASMSMTAVPVLDSDYDAFNVPVEGTFDVAIQGTPAPDLLPQRPMEAAAPLSVAVGTGSVATATGSPSMVTDAVSLPSATAPMASFGASVPIKKPTPLWIYVVALAVVGGGIGGYFVYQSQTSDTTVAPAMAPADEVEAAAPQEEAAPKVEPLVEPTAQPLEEVAEPEPEPEPESDTGAMVKDEADKKEDNKERKDYKRAKKEAPAKTDDKALRDAIDKRRLKAKEDVGKPIVDTSDAKKDIDDLLDQAAVGTVLKKEVKAAPKKPSKTSLSRSDVLASMKQISGKAKGCYNLFEQAGTVKIRFTVSPNGKVTKAGALGKFAGTDTGKCVAKAVKRAKFPEYDGAPKTISYPFLLSP